MTFQEFCDLHEITATSERVDSNPHMDDFDGNHFQVTLRRAPDMGLPTRVLTVHFSQGYGIAGEPTAHGVLECLASDSHALGQTFEEWAADFGFDADSRKAERTYMACLSTARKLEKFLGSERFMALRNCQE